MKLSGSLTGIARNPGVIERKMYMWKVYDESGNFLEILNDVITEPNFSQELNTVGSSMTITLARNSDSLLQNMESLLDSDGNDILDNNGYSFTTTMKSRNKVGVGSSINHNNRVDLYVFYGQTYPTLIGAPNGRRIFSGFISEINIKYGQTENTEVLLMSYGFDLDQYPVTNANDETTVAFNSYDPGNIIRTGITQFKADGIGTYTDYTNTTVPLTSTTVSYTFRVNTYKELLEKAVQLAPSGYNYYVGLGDNLIYFFPKPNSPTHTFILGKHIKGLNLRSYIGDVVNDVIFTGGGEPALFRRTTIAPIAGTRRGLNRMSDSRVTLDSSADILAEGSIDDNKNIQYRSTIEILDKTYDIESIKLGDLIAFSNFNNFVDSVTMQVVAIGYTPDIVTLQLDSIPRSVPKRLEELRKALLTTDNTNAPVEPVIN